ncbi:MAG: alpha/beta hydrolase [Chloroflexi bacterium]|nr:alpha/beta hydrolase [Chloroflexota bacterium]
MPKVISKDGTPIAYDQTGNGPAVILVDGALGYRAFGPSGALASQLAPHFTVISYDRRGRGESGNTLPYALAREVEDINALINQVGGSAFLFGTSSGGCLALEAASALDGKVEKLAIWEAPSDSSPGAAAAWKEYRRQLEQYLAAGQRGDAVALFMSFVGTPADMINGMRQSPMWPLLEAVAPTLPYDAAAMGDDRAVPVQHAATVTAPTLVMNGTMLPFMQETGNALTKAIPHAQHRTLEGQSHDVDIKVLAPVLIEFFSDRQSRASARQSAQPHPEGPRI